MDASNPPSRGTNAEAAASFWFSARQQRVRIFPSAGLVSQPYFRVDLLRAPVISPSLRYSPAGSRRSEGSRCSVLSSRGQGRRRKNRRKLQKEREKQRRCVREGGTRQQCGGTRGGGGREEARMQGASVLLPPPQTTTAGERRCEAEGALGIGVLHKLLCWAPEPQGSSQRNTHSGFSHPQEVALRFWKSTDTHTPLLICMRWGGGSCAVQVTSSQADMRVVQGRGGQCVCKGRTNQQPKQD